MRQMVGSKTATAVSVSLCVCCQRSGEGWDGRKGMKIKTCAGSLGAGLVLNGRNECARRGQAGGVSSGACSAGVRGVLLYFRVTLSLRYRYRTATANKNKWSHTNLGQHRLGRWRDEGLDKPLKRERKKIATAKPYFEQYYHAPNSRCDTPKPPGRIIK